MVTDNAHRTTANIIPALRYRDAATAIEWLCRAFDFEKHLVVPTDDGGIAHAQLTFGNGMIMLGSARDDEYGKLQAPLSDVDAPVSQSVVIIIPDVDAHHVQARAAGARIVIPPEDQPYPEGNLWSFGSYDPWESE